MQAIRPTLQRQLRNRLATAAAWNANRCSLGATTAAVHTSLRCSNFSTAAAAMESPSSMEEAFASTQQQEQERFENNLVRRAIQKMMEDVKAVGAQAQSNYYGETITQQDLEKTLIYFENQLEEARNCISDCREQDADLEVEFKTADIALEKAATAYVDLLDMLRSSNDELNARYKAVRESGASVIKKLRQELGELKPK